MHLHPVFFHFDCGKIKNSDLHSTDEEEEIFQIRWMSTRARRSNIIEDIPANILILCDDCPSEIVIVRLIVVPFVVSFGVFLLRIGPRTSRS